MPAGVAGPLRYAVRAAVICGFAAHRPMDAEPLEALTDAIYRAALEPQAWDEVMGLMSICFPSTAQTFYFLDLAPARMRPMSLTGIEPTWQRSFDETYFAPDNPWIRLTRRLHRPGVIRTNERLAKLMRDDGVLYRSAYFNEWMRPQRFKYTLGNTLLADDGIVANITLLRPPDMATFDDREVSGFERISRHLTRALWVAVQLEQAGHRAGGTAAFDGLSLGVALVEATGRLVYANARLESMLRSREGLTLRAGALVALQPAVQRRLAALLGEALASAGAAPEPLVVPYAAGMHLTVHASRAAGEAARYLPASPKVLLTVIDAAAGRPGVPAGMLRQLYGCTPAEARLVALLVQGHRLRDAAGALGITYDSARFCLKIVFEKVGVHSQAQLVSKVLGDVGR